MPKMTTILEEDQNEYQPIAPSLFSNNHSNSNLLTDWANEQTNKIRVIQDQIKRIIDLPADKLDSLCDYLEDIDYHISGLKNILSLVIDDEANTDELSEDDGIDEMETGNLLTKKWPLLNALWFHMIMITDPESIYYSPQIGCDAWPSQLSN